MKSLKFLYSIFSFDLQKSKMSVGENIPSTFSLEKSISLRYRKPSEHYYAEVKFITSLLQEFLPSNVLLGAEDLSDWLSKHLPTVYYLPHFSDPFSHQFFMLDFFSQEFAQEEFFKDIIDRHLLLEEEYFLSSIRCFHFCIKNSLPLLLVEVTVIVKRKKAQEFIQRRLPDCIQAMRLGYSAIKAAKYKISSIWRKDWNDTSINHKVQQIHQTLMRLAKSFPQFFEMDLMNEWESFATFSSSLFLELRSAKQLIRLIVTNYLLKKSLKRSVLLAQERRHLFCRLFPSQLQSAFGKKSVWGMAIAISLFDKFEQFDEEHVLLAIQKWIPEAYLIHGSRLLYRNPQDDRICLLYVEFDKKERISFRYTIENS